MRKKQWMAAALVGLAVILAGVGSGNVKTRQTKKDKQENTQIVSGVQIVTEDGKKYYDFQDVKENNYRARLLNQVPRNSYDFSNLALDEETGYLSYKDTKGKVSAKKGIDVSEFWNISSRIRLQDLLSMTQKKSKMIQQEQTRIQGKTLRIFVKSFVTE